MLSKTSDECKTYRLQLAARHRHGAAVLQIGCVNTVSFILCTVSSSSMEWKRSIHFQLLCPVVRYIRINCVTESPCENHEHVSWG
jgi:hypothetical protein